MRVAIIDLGTNSVRFDVQQIGPGAKIRRLHREKLMVRLGQGVFLQGRLDPHAVRRTLEAFSSFAATAQSLGVDKIVAFGTSALREASDGDRLLKKIREKTQIDVRVLSGSEEAQLIARGILENERPRKGHIALVDIGGGSTEISICRSKDIRHSESFPLGTARLQQVFLKSSPPKAAAHKGEVSAIDQLRRYIKSVLLPKFIAEEWPRVDEVIGSSGTIRALSKLTKGAKNSKKKNGRGIELKELSKLVVQMSTMNTTELMGIAGMEPKRIDMILAGAILLEETMLALRAKRAVPTEYSLRDGILAEERRLHGQHKTSNIEFHLDDLLKKADALGISEAHLKQVRTLAEGLFDGLKSIHKLKPTWKTYLSAAAILHDTGEAISPTNHELHSYYIVKNSDFPSMELWETEFVAQLCLWHRGGKPDPKSLPFAGNKSRRDAFMKLLSLLRIADALDRGHKGNARVVTIRQRRGEIQLTLGPKTKKDSVDLELLRIEQKKNLFESVFKRRLTANAV